MQKKWSTIRLILGLSICFTFIMAGSVNQGFTGPLMSVPFVFIGAFLIYKKISSIKLKLLVVSLALMPGYFLFSDHSENTLIYPSIGDEITLACDWDARYYPKKFVGFTYGSIAPSNYTKYPEDLTSIKKLPCGTKLTLKRILVRHPDLGTSYNPVFLAHNGEEFVITGYNFSDILESEIIDFNGINHPNELQSSWSFNLSTLMMYPVSPWILFYSISSYF
ncbi:hypothetical protein L3V77_17435 [Vibrio sp. DW001]|uniref:hypothetical protein n=1 Tax=Vibrio sp. DW001 TaxID=2912315 RepID=UPI0023AED0A1|nr:hypothetical protein [Vibrio sp. DW001]WED29214.1 hypothetical protein L3V77_17435 [Vibrio sp. DW001]